MQSKNSSTLWHIYTCQQSLPLLTQEAFLFIEKGGMEVDTPHSYIHVDVCTYVCTCNTMTFSASNGTDGKVGKYNTTGRLNHSTKVVICLKTHILVNALTKLGQLSWGGPNHTYMYTYHMNQGKATKVPTCTYTMLITLSL